MSRRMIMAGMAAAGVMVTASAAAAPATPERSTGPSVAACAQAYDPWFSAYTYTDPPTAVPDLGASIACETGPPDTDGDGKPDVIGSGDAKKVQITRGDGVVTLSPGDKHNYIYLTGYGPQPGDLDGDGRDELIIGVDQQGEQYLLPGTTAPGTYDIPDVAIHFDGLSSSSRPVGDQNGDGSDDVAFPGEISPGKGGWAIYAGKDLLAPGAGGNLTAPPPIATYRGENLIAASLKPGAAPTIITGSRYPSSTNVTVFSSPPIQFIARDVLAEYTGGPGKLEAFSKGGQAFVTVSASDRSGSSIAIWNVDDPCSRFATQAPPPTTTPAPIPAKPLAGSANFTG